MAERAGPLSGVRAVTCSTAQAGTVPYMMMADLGAEVIKVEVPGVGDGSRTAGELRGEISSFFETNNRGVKSVTLDLKSAEGRKILHRLIETADIFGQNFRPGAAEKNGFGYEELKKINPKLVYVSVSGYGQRGPHSGLPGTDAVGQALGGISEAYAGPGEAMKTGVVSVADESCAMLTFGGLLAALYHAKNTGIGQKVETSLVGGIVRLMGWTMTTTMWRDENPIVGARINGTRELPGIAASFDDKDGKPLVFQVDHRHWTKAMDALGFLRVLKKRGASDLGLALVSDEKKQLILSTLKELFATGSRDRWVSILRDADIVSAPINTLLEASKDPDVVENGYIAERYYSEIGETLKVQGSPWQFSETPVSIGRAPKLGEHNDEVLEAMGFSKAEIKSMSDRNII
ncbi:MAG: CoA transferase [Rhodospirillaceae bacterium]|jgi:crotonobetainyl-CoA:carnitine CoA-transferase CaiB-like acyl-CoA transferase|nr:CoA transferase [Rhodospirillaceae bacterium]OUU61675.1 MAG: CoA transferase [Candidatus Endolissoclinum sp. TMED55]|tara:strand:+ start:4000 stop:5211 length:1212 start_codon:yes stop_codon:yes gene_type:complete